MLIRKKRSQYFWVFSSYSFVFHLVGILALIILIGPTTSEPDSSPIPVRLVVAFPDKPEILPKTKVSKIPRPEKLGPSTPGTAAFTQPASSSFRVMAPVHISPRNEPERATPSPHPLVQVATNILVSPIVTQGLSRGQGLTDLEARPTRVLVDHKAGSSLTGSTPPKVLYNPVPQYPQIARELGLEGKTLLRVEILQDGRLGAIKVRESCGHTLLDEAATKAIKNWKFAPAHDGLFTVRSVVDLPIRFSLKSLG
ncbi:MAG: TonB family protein [Nitrospirae bacterium]|nr:TonB family protein [Nitrospirota bacterium]MDA1304037.1 TonB family protein [Nitrospirota bacterium]